MERVREELCLEEQEEVNRQRDIVSTVNLLSHFLKGLLLIDQLSETQRSLSNNHVREKSSKFPHEEEQVLCAPGIDFIIYILSASELS